MSISIVTVCRNAEATIARTIESIRAQRYPSLEYIVIDGASTDSTPDIVRSYNDIVDIFVSEPDQGIADAFNKGVQLTHGDIIGLINADDQLCPDTLETICNFFRKHPDVDVVHGDVILFDGHKAFKRVKPAARWWYPWRLVLFNHPTTFVRKSVYKNYGLFDTTYRIAMDVEIFLRWIHAQIAIEYLEKPLVIMQTGGASGVNVKLAFDEKRRAFLRYRYPRIGVELQYLGHFAVQMIVWLQSFKRNRIKTSRSACE